MAFVAYVRCGECNMTDVDATVGVKGIFCIETAEVVNLLIV